MNLSYIYLAYLALIGLSMFDNGRSASYAYFIEFFDIKTSKASLIFSFGTVMGLLANLTAKYWLPFFGIVRSASVALGFITFGCLTVYLSAVFRSFEITLVGAGFGGLGMGFLSVAMNILVTEGSESRLRKKYLSGLHGVYGLSSLTAPLLLNMVIGLGYSWKEFFLFISLIGLCVFLYSLRVEDNHKESLRERTAADQGAFKDKLLVGLFLAFYVSGEILISSRLSFYLIDYLSYDPKLANQFLSVFFLCLMSGRLMFAFFNFRFSTERVIFTCLCSSLVTCVLGFWIHPIFLCLLGLTMAPVFPLSIDWIKEVYNETSHIFIAFSMTCVGLLLSVLHLGIGMISTNFSIRVALYSYFAFFALALLFFSIATKKSRH